jgi:hypothetical protein
MYSFQAGVKAILPLLPFASVTLRYTKIEPYCYTHPTTTVPWNITRVDTSYVNNGEALGHYLPPNSDEFFARLESPAFPGAQVYLQYQLIRHGAEYGDGRVYGSSYYDEHYYDGNTKKYFLRDGVYRWDNVIKVGGAYNLKALKIPLRVFAEAGVDIARFSRNRDKENTPYHFLPLSDSVYKGSTGLIFSLGFKLFP